MMRLMFPTSACRASYRAVQALRPSCRVIIRGNSILKDAQARHKSTIATRSGINRDTLYGYTSGRFLWEETSQRAWRWLEFTVDELAHIAAKCVGSQPCVQLSKLPEGSFNKTFLFTMSDGKEVVAKLPCPNAGLAHFTTASEVATMDFVSSPTPSAE